MRLKKILSCCIAFVMATLGIFSGIFNGHAAKVSAAIDYTSLFDFSYAANTQKYTPKFKTGWEEIFKTLGSDKRLEIPDTYDDSSNGEHVVTFISDNMDDSAEGLIEELRLPASYGSTITGDLRLFKNLKKVEFPYTGIDFTIKGTLEYDRFDKDTPTLEEIYIYASGISDDFSKTAFRGIVDNNYKIYVTSEDVKQAIIKKTSEGDYAVTEDHIEVMEEQRPLAEFTISCEDIYAGTAGGFQPKADVTSGDGEIQYTLYDDPDCTKPNTRGIHSPSLPVGTYYIKAVMLPSDTNAYTESNVLTVQVKENVADKTALKAAIAEADDFYEKNSSNQVNFDAKAWSAVYTSADGALALAKRIADDETGRYKQAEVDDATENLKTALETLKNSPADTTEAWDALQEVIQQAEAIVDRVKNGEIAYTDASYSKLESRLGNAKALEKNTATIKSIQNETRWLQEAIDGLELKNEEVSAGKPFAYVYKGGKETLVLSMTAPDAMAGAKKIKVTFDCAEDVSFNEYADIDITALVAGTKSFQKFYGVNYETGATRSVELPLEAEIKAGDSVELAAATWSWDNAKDYVYGITKLEFMDTEGRILYTVIDQDIARVNLASAIKDAEGIDASAYTEDSFAKLTKALEDAKALKDDATVEEINQAIEAINDAINGLVKKTGDDKKPGDDKDTSGDNNGTGQDTPQVIGTAQGKVFTAGNFQYKVTTAATITAVSQKKTDGKVTVVGLTKAGKKKSSISVKNTVSVSGVTYQVTAIGNKAFQKAAKLKKATLGTNIKAIPTSAFDGCRKLTAVSAAGVTKIEKSAFKGCKALKKLTLKKKLASAKKGAFKGCKKTIKVAGGSKKVNKANVKKLKKAGYKKFK